MRLISGGTVPPTPKVGVRVLPVLPESYAYVTNALSNGTIPDPLRPPLVWAWPGTATIFEYPLLTQEQVKLRTSNLAGTFI